MHSFKKKRTQGAAAHEGPAGGGLICVAPMVSRSGMGLGRFSPIESRWDYHFSSGGFVGEGRNGPGQAHTIMPL